MLKLQIPALLEDVERQNETREGVSMVGGTATDWRLGGRANSRIEQR